MAINRFCWPAPGRAKKMRFWAASSVFNSHSLDARSQADRVAVNEDTPWTVYRDRKIDWPARERRSHDVRRAALDAAIDGDA